MASVDGRKRVVIESIAPQVDNGEFPVKRIVGEKVDVTVDLLFDGHDEIRASILFKSHSEKKWQETPLKYLSNDHWEGHFSVIDKGLWHFCIEAWIDYPVSWLKEIHKKIIAQQMVTTELLTGALLLEQIAKTYKIKKTHLVFEWIKTLRDDSLYEEAINLSSQKELKDFIYEFPLKDNASKSSVFEVWAERRKAEFSTWYEFFPRSSASEHGKHGTLKDAERIVKWVADHGFDVIYFPPIHPIGIAHRKGKNNATTAQPGEPGSPWAIGNHHGGHKSLHPELGSWEDFDHLIKFAKKKGIEIALDFALQCSPDHPYVKDHPEWFKWRPDGTVQYAENPPKKYQDVLPIYFETKDWKNLWDELKSILLFWIEKGVTIFRVDNPHTKPFVFWEWILSEIRKEHPDVIFLSEAFTRPKIMHRLAKIGFTQSYTYFTWRTQKYELVDYVNELTKSAQRNFFRPNFWPNTPDILPYDLQNKGYAEHAIRFVLAATLSASYGIYGPVYDLLVAEPYPGKEEYNNSEKYECCVWDWETETPMRKLIAAVNQLRNSHAAFQSTYNITFCETDNQNIIAYLKVSREFNSVFLVVVNLDPEHAQSGFVRMPLDKLGLIEGTPVTMNDLLNHEQYIWNKASNYVMLNPLRTCAHIMQMTW